MIAGPEISLYSPLLALSETVMIPILISIVFDSDRKKVTFTQSKITTWVLTVDRALLKYATKIRCEFYAFELPVL